MLKAILFALTTLFVAFPGVAQGRSCAPSGSVVKQAAGNARVYQRQNDLFACGPGRRVHIGYTIHHLPPEPCVAPVNLVTLQPRYIAWHESASCHEQRNWLIHVEPLTAGKGRGRILRDGNASCAPSCTNIGVGEAVALTLTAAGSVAWIAADATSNDGSREVWKAVWRRSSQRLARASDIDRSFLAWKKSLVEWRQGGVIQRG
jgi:hypothetical protein